MGSKKQGKPLSTPSGSTSMLGFGTDGIRGIANVDLTPEAAVAIGCCIADVLSPERVYVGRDTRVSGPVLQSALSAGLASMGVDVIDLGVLPTGGIAHAAISFGSPAVVVSASHNLYLDNGIKVFSSDGRKISSEAEAEIEKELKKILIDNIWPHRNPRQIGSIRPLDYSGEYLAYLSSCVEQDCARGLKVAIDGANGAAFSTAVELMGFLGAEVVAVTGDSPDGYNINDGVGSTHPLTLAELVVGSGADLGLAFDGDADRMIAIDEAGAVIDGDFLLCIFALDLAERGLLKSSRIAVTVMSNIGLERALRSKDISVERTSVGDRFVLEALERDRLSLGGEQSGHIIFTDHASTGDGLLSGAMLLAVMKRRGVPLSELAGGAMVRYPQVLRSVRVPDNFSGLEDNLVSAVVDKVSVQLGENGRVLVRPSGTEPVVRVMVEAESEQVAQDAVERICAVLEQWRADL